MRKKLNKLACRYEMLHLSPLSNTPLMHIINHVAGFGTSGGMHDMFLWPGPPSTAVKQNLTEEEIQGLFDGREIDSSQE